jgi:hypothetical protein
MNKALLVAAGLLLAPVPALSQAPPRSEDRASSYEERDRDGWREDRLWRLMRDMRDDTDGGPRRGAGFLLRRGDATVAVRCDPRDSMRTCVDATLTLLDRARSLAPEGGAAPSPGPPSPPR